MCANGPLLSFHIIPGYGMSFHIVSAQGMTQCRV